MVVDSLTEASSLVLILLSTEMSRLFICKMVVFGMIIFKVSEYAPGFHTPQESINLVKGIILGNYKEQSQRIGNSESQCPV